MVDQTSSITITENGSYNVMRTGGAKENTIYVYGTIGSATLELHGPGGLIEDGGIATLPYQKVVNHGGIPVNLIVTGAAGTTVQVRVG